MDFPLPAGPTTNCAYRGILNEIKLYKGRTLDRFWLNLWWYAEFDFIWLRFPRNRFVSIRIILFHCELPFLILKHNCSITFQIFWQYGVGKSVGKWRRRNRQFYRPDIRIWFTKKYCLGMFMNIWSNISREAVR